MRQQREGGYPNMPAYQPTADMYDYRNPDIMDETSMLQFTDNGKSPWHHRIGIITSVTL